MLAELVSAEFVLRAMLAPRMAEFSDKLRLPAEDRAMFCVLALPMALLISRVSATRGDDVCS